MSMRDLNPFLEMLEELSKKDCCDENLLQLETKELNSIMQLQDLLSELVEEYNVKGYVEKTLFEKYKAIVKL